jgi:hypothetical protein
MLFSENIKRLVLSIVVLGTAIFNFGCDEECPGCPNRIDPISDYDIVLCGREPDDPLVIYNTKEMTIRDTLYLSNGRVTEGMAVSGDGGFVLLSAHESGSSIYSLMIYDLNTFDLVHDFRAGEKLEVSGTGRYIATFGPHIDSIIFLDGTDFEVIFTDNRAFMNGRFSADESRFYGVSHTNEIFVYDIGQQALDTIIEYYDNWGNPVALGQVLPSPDFGKLYLWVDYNPSTNFIVSYHHENDTTLLMYPVGQPGGDIRITPDAKWLIVTDPGNVVLEQPGSQQIIFIDAATDAVVSLLSPLFALEGGITTELYPGQLAITPDSRYTIVANAEWKSFGMIDNRIQKFVDIEYKSVEGAVFHRVSCQKIP